MTKIIIIIIHTFLSRDKVVTSEAVEHDMYDELLIMMKVLRNEICYEHYTASCILS